MMAAYDIAARINALRSLASQFEIGLLPVVDLPLPHTIARLNRMTVPANKARILRRMADYLEVNNG